MDWLTNDRTIARKLLGAERKHQKAREAATDLPLAEKIAAYRKAKAEYGEVIANLRLLGYPMPYARKVHTR